MTADPSYTGSDLRWSASDATDPAFAGLGELVRASAEGIFVVDSNHRYVYANPAGCELLGYPLSGLVGRDVLTDLPAWQRASGHAHFEIARRGELTRGTFVVTRADGSQLHVEAASSVLKLDGEQFIVTFVHDVSERLRQESQAAALAQAAASVAITDSVDGTVQAVAECVLQGTRALGAWVSLHDEEGLGTWIGMAGLPDGAQEGIRQADRTTASYARFMQDLMAHRVVVFPEARQQAESSPRTARFAQALKPLPWRAAALAPLTFQGRVIGLLNAIYREDELPTAAEATFIAALAEHAAIAGANARLVAAAEKKISMGERRRLARELHDSVSQDLFGIELGANRARELLENDPARAVRPIEYVLELAKASRAEMRALIFDLRPESLEADGLVMSINRKIEALRVRHGIAAPAVTGEEPEVPLEVKEALYRIALESLQNAVKHANARRVDVTLKTRRTTVVLEIKDDGAGFDTEAAFHGHLGLRSMHERAFEVGGSLDILSSPQKGTSIVVRVPSAATDRRSRERTSRSVDLQSRPPPRRSSLSPNVSAKASIPLTSASARGCCDC